MSLAIGPTGGDVSGTRTHPTAHVSLAQAEE
jgi:hypothetical protein